MSNKVKSEISKMERLDVPKSERTQLDIRLRSQHAAQDGMPRVFEFALIDAGLNARGWDFPADVLTRDAALFSGVTSLINHTDLMSHPNVENVLGAFQDVRFDSGLNALVGDLVVAPTGARLVPMLEHVLAEQSSGRKTPNVGMSADVQFMADGKRVTQITHVYSCDLVFNPAAGGQLLRAKNNSGGVNMTQANETVTVSETTPAASPEQVALVSGEEARRQGQELLRAQCANLLESVLLANADLPAIQRDQLRARFSGKVFPVAELSGAVSDARAIYAEMLKPNVIKGINSHGMGQSIVRGMWSAEDVFQAAIDRLLGNEVPDTMKDAPRLTGIKEAYILATGDREMYGRFNPERVMLANGNTATLPGVVKNALNKRLANAWATLAAAGYDWFRKIVLEDDFDSIQQISWVNAGGFGDLPTVSEGAAYSELAWTDNTETVSFLKKGGYIGITLEMIDRDDVAKIKSIPTALANAALRTLSATVSNLFTQASGAGPTLADSNALFSAAHGSNNGSTALAAAAWDTAIQTVFKFTQLNSARRLAIRPRFLVVPIELEKTAWQILGQDIEPASNVFYKNVRETDVFNVVVNPELTSGTMWHAMTDPRVYPALGVGYRFGRQPELFVADQPELGSMFTNDEMRIKARWFVAVGVIDWRGAYRGNT